MDIQQNCVNYMVGRTEIVYAQHNIICIISIFNSINASNSLCIQVSGKRNPVDSLFNTENGILKP